MNIVKLLPSSKEYAAFSHIYFDTPLYSPLNIEYSIEYHKKSHFLNLSFGIEYKSEIVGIFVLFLNSSPGGAKIDGGGRPAYFKIKPGLSTNEVKSVCSVATREMKRVITEHPGASLDYLEAFPSGALSKPGGTLVEMGAELSFGLTSRINLSKEISSLKSDIRKSYKSFLNWGHSNLNISVIDSSNVNHEDIYTLRDFHVQFAGRQTRSNKTWELQCQMIRNGEAFMIKSQYLDRLASASLFLCNKTISYYGVSVSDRELFDYPISHAPMWRAVEYAKGIGCDYFELGGHIFTSSENTDKKILNISKYKRGFGGGVFPYAIITYPSHSPPMPLDTA